MKHLLVLLLAATLPAVADSLPPAVFGIGFTDVTDTSARLVYTTSEPMTSTVVVTSHDKEITRLPQEAFDEIHAVAIPNLTKGEDYQIVISGVTKDGKTVASDAVALKPTLRPFAGHAWPGYTIFSTSVAGNNAEAGYDLLTQSGVRMYRVECSWSSLFPRNGKDIDQKYLDQFVARIVEMKKHNIEPLLVLDYCVAWAKPYTSNTMTWRNVAFGPPDRLEDWGNYVRTVVTALKGNVKYYEIWNEPDAGYLATGNYVERPNVPPPIGRAPFKDNWHYWLGDRFVPMIAQVRKVMSELQPDAVLLNGGWNRDYSSTRGDLLLERGVAPDLDVYAFHCYASNPISFARWYNAIDGGFRRSIDRNFTKYKIQMPLAVTEWGYPAWETPQPSKGFVTFEDAQKFFVKSTFYFLGLQRVEILSQFCLGIGPANRDQDPSFFTLVDSDAAGKIIQRPSYGTFKWLATTFGSKPYRALPVKVAPSEQVKAFAIQMKDAGETYLAIWQDGVPDDKGVIPAQPAREVQVSLEDLIGTFNVQLLGLDGSVVSQSKVTADYGLSLKITLPEISATAESGIYLARISAATK